VSEGWGARVDATSVAVVEQPPAVEPARPAPVARAERPPGLVLDRCLAAAAGLVAVVTGLVNLGRFPIFAEGEGIYAMQAWSVLHGRLSPYPYWYDHPFLGWVQMAPFLALGRWLSPGSSAVVDTRLASVAALGVDAALLYVIARRLELRRGTAVLAVAALVCSPLVHDEMRRAFLDNMAMPWTLAALALALGARSWDRGPIAAGACFAVAVLNKETTLLLAPVVLVALAGRLPHGQRRAALRAAGWAFAAIASVYPLYALARDQLLPVRGRISLVRALRWQLIGRNGSGSVLNPASTRHHDVVHWLTTDPYLTVGGLAAALILLSSPRLCPVALGVLIPAVWVVRPGGYMPAMFVITILPFLALCLAAAAERLLLLVAAGARRVLAAGDPQPWGRPAGQAAAAGWLSLTLLAATLPVQRHLHGSDVFVAVNNRLPAQAVEWIEQNIPASRRLLVDDAIWIDLAIRGRTDPWQQAIWFYKADTDPAARRRLPDGWRDIDYVISTRTFRRAIGGQPNLTLCREAARRSVVVRTFGAGVERIEVRRVLWDSP
jgi:Dolichyl-phosphate-mannose-protein mannosyltransferase